MNYLVQNLRVANSRITVDGSRVAFQVNRQNIEKDKNLLIHPCIPGYFRFITAADKWSSSCICHF